MGLMTPEQEALYGMKFTKTIHSAVPANLDPTKTTLPSPFVVVVTGAGKGLGYHMALAFAKAKASGISISSRTQSDLDALEKEILSISPNSQVLKSVCDTRDTASVEKLATEVRQKWHRADVVIANAGIISNYITDEQKDKNRPIGSNLPIGIMEDDDWSRVLDINLHGVWRTAKAFTPLLRDTTDGPQTIICSSSLASLSLTSIMCPIAYNISKFACNRLVEHIDADHKGKDGIHAYALHPGAVLTPQTNAHEADADMWGQMLGDDVALAGAMCVWLAKEKRGWLGGRYVACNWDVDELEAKKDEIVQKELLKFRMNF